MRSKLHLLAAAALLVVVASLSGVAAFSFSPPGPGPNEPPPLRRQNAMRMSYGKPTPPPQGKGPLRPPSDDELEALERRLPPAVATMLRWASTAVMGGAYLASPALAPRPAEAVTSTTVLTGSVMEATCLGFGCGSYQGQDFAGAPKPAGEASIDMQAFLKAVDDKRVAKVELLDGGNVAYATIKMAAASTDAPATEERLRIGEGFPVDNPKAWSSPLWVVRILKDKQIPYTLKFDFSGAATKASAGGPPQF